MEDFFELIKLDFFRNALLSAIMAAVSCGIVGTWIVSRRLVFISGGISHSIFGGIGIAYFLGLNPLLGASVFAVLTALGVDVFSKKGSVREDSTIAILWSLGMAIGIIFISLTPGYAPNLMSYLFGSILTVSTTDLWFMAILTFIVIVFFALFLNLIFFIAFDEQFARTRGIPVTLFNRVLLIIAAFTIVVNIRVSGAILVLSLLTLPQATANLFTKNYRTMIIASIILGFIGAFTGLIVSYYTDLPSGATIIIFLTLFFLVARAFAYFKSQTRIAVKR